MASDQVWQQLKNDKSLIYGKPIIDVFLQLTKTLSAKHFLELNKEQIENLSTDATIDVIWRAKDIEKISEILGSQGFDKLDSNQINYILKTDKDFYAAEDIKDAKKAQVFTRTDAILKYRNLNKTDVRNILLSRTDSKDLKKVLNIIEKEKLKLLKSKEIFSLIIDYLYKFGMFDFNEGFEMFEIFVQSLGTHINNLTEEDVWKLIATGIPGIQQFEESNKYLEQILNLLGDENLKKITNDQINELLTQNEFRQKIGIILQKRRV